MVFTISFLLFPIRLWLFFVPSWLFHYSWQLPLCLVHSLFTLLLCSPYSQWVFPCPLVLFSLSVCLPNSWRWWISLSSNIYCVGSWGGIVQAFGIQPSRFTHFRSRFFSPSLILLAVKDWSGTDGLPCALAYFSSVLSLSPPQTLAFLFSTFHLLLPLLPWVSLSLA